MDVTDDIIQKALKEEEAEKRLKKQAKQAEAKDKRVAKKGKTLEQIESEEGGPIKESMVGMAHSKRASKRKGGGGIGDTELVADVEEVEEDLEVEEEDGVKLEAFNLKEERRRGYFDEGGNYVEREVKDEDEVEDAWLKSDEAKVVSEETRRRIEAQQARMAAAEAAAPLTATQIARLQFQVSQLLLPEETVTRALKRLGGHSRTARPQKRSKSGTGQAGAGAGAGARTGAAADKAGAGPEMDPAQAKEQFERLTEAASNLMDAGETDVYGQTKEYFERCAAVYIDLPGPSNLFDAGPSKVAYEEADEDMFAADSDDEAAAAKQKEGGPLPLPQPAAAVAPPAGGAQRGAAPPAGGPPAASAGAAEVAGDGTDYDSWPVKELRRFLTERGQSADGIIDKADLVTKVREMAAADAAAAAVAPPGYAFDPATGYWYSADAGLYWDGSSGGFFNSESGKWYSWDSAKQQFVEWQK